MTQSFYLKALVLRESWDHMTRLQWRACDEYLCLDFIECLYKFLKQSRIKLSGLRRLMRKTYWDFLLLLFSSGICVERGTMNTTRQFRRGLSCLRPGPNATWIKMSWITYRSEVGLSWPAQFDLPTLPQCYQASLIELESENSLGIGQDGKCNMHTKSSNNMSGFFQWVLDRHFKIRFLWIRCQFWHTCVNHLLNHANVTAPNSGTAWVAIISSLVHPSDWHLYAAYQWFPYLPRNSWNTYDKQIQKWCWAWPFISHW